MGQLILSIPNFGVSENIEDYEFDGEGNLVVYLEDNEDIHGRIINQNVPWIISETHEQEE